MRAHLSHRFPAYAVGRVFMLPVPSAPIAKQRFSA
jgi:hypothetical protein